MSWRSHLHKLLQPTNGPIHVYEFGVFTGDSMIAIQQEYDKADLQIDMFYGLDSFEGLPKEKNEPNWQPGCWDEGCFNSQEYFAANGVDDCMIKLYEKLTPHLGTKFELIPGFYSESLDKTLISRYNMGVAHYVDIDVDIYTSTVEVLDFLLQNKLMQPGTIVGFDDIGGVPVDFETAGEGRAWKEAREKYGIKAQLLGQIGNAYPHVHQFWQVI